MHNIGNILDFIFDHSINLLFVNTYFSIYRQEWSVHYLPINIIK